MKTQTTENPDFLGTFEIKPSGETCVYICDRYLA